MSLIDAEFDMDLGVVLSESWGFNDPRSMLARRLKSSEDKKVLQNAPNVK